MCVCVWGGGGGGGDLLPMPDFFSVMHTENEHF